MMPWKMVKSQEWTTTHLKQMKDFVENDLDSELDAEYGARGDRYDIRLRQIPITLIYVSTWAQLQNVMMRQ